MSVTQQEIANHLGVSRQLVNFALNGGGTVSEQKRREILAIAGELGYRRNDLAALWPQANIRFLAF
jgi:LacI family transcriptional regulator